MTKQRKNHQSFSRFQHRYHGHWMVVVLVVFAALITSCGGGDDTDRASSSGGPTQSTDSGGGDRDIDPETAALLKDVQSERIGEIQHRPGRINYGVPVPTGGDHNPVWLTCGSYDGEVPVELAVHSLEHGAVWIALGPDSTAEDRAVAEELAEGQKVIVSDVEDLTDPINMVAWGKRLVLPSLGTTTAADPSAVAFIEVFIDSDDAPEPGVSCENLGNPPTPPELPAS